MIFNICTGCSHVNPAGAQACQTCGRRFGTHPTGAPTVRITAEWRSSGALWLDQLEPPAPDTEPPPVAITLRDIELPVVDDAVPPGRADRRHGAPAEVVAADTEPLPPATAPGAGDLDAWLAADRAAARAAVRRARLRRAAAQAAEGVAEVLVFDRDDSSRDQLCELLRGFGFGVHSVSTIGKATALAASRRFVAGFVDIPLDTSDGGAGVALCRRLRQSDTRGGAPTVLVLVTAQLRPVDRVRAELAGCDDVLIKPPARGAVARVLDSRGVALPSDARRL